MISKIYGNIGVDLLSYKEGTLVYYTPIVTFFFEPEGKQNISIACDIRSVDSIQVLRQALDGINKLFIKISALVNVIDNETLQIIEVINLNEIFPCEDNEFVLEKDDSPVYLH